MQLDLRGWKQRPVMARNGGILRTYCGDVLRRDALPTGEELRELDQTRLRSHHFHDGYRAKKMQLLHLHVKQERERVRLQRRRKYRQKRLQQLESTAFRRLVHILESEEGSGGAGVVRRMFSSSVAAAIGSISTSSSPSPSSSAAVASSSPGKTPLQWVGPPALCESSSDLVRTTLATAAASCKDVISLLNPAAVPVHTELFDQMLIVGLPLESLREPVVSLGGTYTSKIIFTYPEGAVCTTAVSEFCLPQGVTVTPLSSRSSSNSSSPHTSAAATPIAAAATTALTEMKEVMFVLSGGGTNQSETSYGMCLHLKRPCRFSDQVLAQADLCYCFISRHPFLPLHLGVLRALVRMHLSPDFFQIASSSTPTITSTPSSFSSSPKSSYSALRSRSPTRNLSLSPFAQDLERERHAVLRITQALHRFAAISLPNPGEEVEFNVFESLPQALAVPTYFRRPSYRPDEENDNARWIREWALPLLLGAMSLENVLLVLFSMLTEMQVVVVCKDLQLLSATVLALPSLLRPLEWAGPLIVTLPAKHMGYLESPVPFLSGVEELPYGFEHTKGMVVVYPDTNRVTFHPAEDEVSKQLVAHQISWVTASMQEAHREVTACSLSSSSLRRTRPAQGTAEDWEHFITPPRPISPAYCSEPRPDSYLSILNGVVPAAVGGVQSAMPPVMTGSLSLTKSSMNLERRMMEEVCAKVHAHVSAVVEVALNIDLVYRPQRPVLDRRRSSVVEERMLDPATRGWWKECLGKNGRGALFMKRFMETQLFSNHRYSDGVCKRDGDRLRGNDSFSPRYRSLSPAGGHNLSLRRPQSPSSSLLAGSTPLRDDGSFPPDLPHHQDLTETFELAIFGGRLRLAREEDNLRASAEAAAQGMDVAFLHKPCNGMCGGRSNTPDCTLLCLEVWQDKVLHARRKEILKEHTLAVGGSPGAARFDYNALVLTKAPHSRELPSQYRRRLRLVFGEAAISARQRCRVAGKKELYFRHYKAGRRQQLQLLHRAAFIITAAVRKVAAQHRRDRLVKGVTRLQALSRGQRCRREIEASRVLHRFVCRVVARVRSQRRRRQALALAAAAAAAAAAAKSRPRVGSPSVATSPASGRIKEEAENDEQEEEEEEKESPWREKREDGSPSRQQGSGGGGSRLWNYLVVKRRRQEPQVMSSDSSPASMAAANYQQSLLLPTITSSTSSSSLRSPYVGLGSMPSSSSSVGLSSELLLGAHGPGAVLTTVLEAAAETREDEEEEEGGEGEEPMDREERGEMDASGAHHEEEEARPKSTPNSGHRHEVTGSGSLLNDDNGDAVSTNQMSERIRTLSERMRTPPPRYRSSSRDSLARPPSRVASRSRSPSRPRSATPPRRGTRLLLQESGNFERGIVTIEKGPLPLQALRKGLHVHKFNRKGHPERRTFFLEDKGPLAYSPRLAWRPVSAVGRALRRILHAGKPCHLSLIDAFAGVDSSGKSPRIVLALTNQPPLVRAVGTGEEARLLTFGLSRALEPECKYEFELLPDPGMSGEDALEYYLRLLVTLQTLCSTRGAPPQSPNTPKP